MQYLRRACSDTSLQGQSHASSPPGRGCLAVRSTANSVTNHGIIGFLAGRIKGRRASWEGLDEHGALAGSGLVHLKHVAGKADSPRCRAIMASRAFSGQSCSFLPSPPAAQALHGNPVAMRYQFRHSSGLAEAMLSTRNSRSTRPNAAIAKAAWSRCVGSNWPPSYFRSRIGSTSSRTGIRFRIA